MNFDVPMRNKLAWVAVPLGLALFLVVSSLGKLFDIESFAQALADHGVVPMALQSGVTWGVPLAEMAAGLGALWILVNQGPISTASRLLLSVYGALFAYTLWLWAVPPESPSSCGCGLSSAPVESWGLLAARNASFTVLLVAASLVGHMKPSLVRLSR